MDSPDIVNLDLTNWSSWSTYWKTRLAGFDLWKYTNPDTTDCPPPKTEDHHDDDVGRERRRQAADALFLLSQHVGPKCRHLLVGQTTLRDAWSALQRGCDSGGIEKRILMDRAKAFFGAGWEIRDTLESYTGRLQDCFLAVRNSPYEINEDLAVHVLVDGLPPTYAAIGELAKTRSMSFLQCVLYLQNNFAAESSSSLSNNIGRLRTFAIRGGGRGRRRPRRGGGSKYPDVYRPGGRRGIRGRDQPRGAARTSGPVVVKIESD
jgi:hypothetical protein